MDIFAYTDYKAWVKEKVALLPKRGHGQFRRIADKLGTSSVIISQIFRGPRHLTLEQANDLADHFELTTLERRYLLLLVNRERAGTHRLRQVLEEEMKDLQKKSQELKNRLPQDQEFSDATRAVFYSHWYYSAVRNLTAIPRFQDLDAVAAHLGLPRAKMKAVVDFLVQHGLCVLEGDKLKVGPQRTHLPADSPFVTRHHQNWRYRGFVAMEKSGGDELFYTGPMSLSEKAYAEARAEIISVVSRVRETAVASAEETAACLNIDLFRY